MTCGKNKVAAMKRRVTLQTPTRASDGQGGYTDSWADVVDFWASIEPLKGYERIQAMQTETPLTHRITMRYREGVSTACRLVYKGRIFNIKQAINPDEDDAFLELLAVELAA